jgi:transcriptional regulator with XRE-family HTH domain
MRSADLLREARLRAGLTQAALGRRIGQPQSVIARWERGAAIPSFETLCKVIRGCGLECTLSLSNIDESTGTVIDEHLNMTPAQRLADLVERVEFFDQLSDRAKVGQRA